MREISLQNGEEKIRVNLRTGKAVIIAVIYTNQKWAFSLQEKGIPLIADETVDQTKTNALIKQTLFATRSGGGPTAVKPMLLKSANTSIDGTGRQQNLPEGASINGLELFDALELEEDVYLRTRKRATQVRIARGEEYRGSKFTTKIYSIPVDKIDAKMKKGDGSKKLPKPEAREILKELINVTWYVHIKYNPESTTFNLTSRQPDNKNPNMKPSPFSFFSN